MARQRSRDKRRSYRFTSLSLENWRNFVDVDVKLRRRVFLVGPNASGKSNFLDVFRFLSDIAGVGGGVPESSSRARRGFRDSSSGRAPLLGYWSSRDRRGTTRMNPCGSIEYGLLRITTGVRSSRKRPSTITGRRSSRDQIPRTTAIANE